MTETQSPTTPTPSVDHAVALLRRANELVPRSARSRTGLDGYIQTLHATADDLDERMPSGHDRVAQMWSTPPDAGPQSPGRFSPVIGGRNAVAPPLVFDESDYGSVHSVVELGGAYQGPPGFVHGGVAALMMDVALARANRSTRTAGMTAQLSLRYRQPTPLYRRLEIRARHDRADGRKAFSTGEILVDGTVTVSAEGLFIRLRRGGDDVDR